MPEDTVPPETPAKLPDEPLVVVVSDAKDSEVSSSALPFPIVGIGASAGGLEAFIDLLQTTPADTGMAFVIISHLAATRKSFLADILRRNTLMQVIEIEDHIRPQPNRVYVIPPNTRLSLKDGSLRLEPRPDRDPSPRPIDIFFRSLAETQKNRAIGIVLSGTDSDGALGLKAIKGDGGISIVQDERTAKFEDMPRNAIAGDHVDLVLSPAQIGTELAQIAHRFRQIREIQEVPEDDQQQRAIDRIFSLLRGLKGVDFSIYKQTTIRRRIARRMLVTKIDTLVNYAAFLERNEEELGELFEDALIGVTQFFRDPEVFEALRNQVFPDLLKDRDPALPIRIWVPGCATGEEVYSIAICLLEAMGRQTAHSAIQIFGTDVSERSIDAARAAIYLDSISSDVSPDRLRRFFVKLDKGYQISKRIRELCIFAVHNLAQDPPYSRLDMVSCRNMLIYLGATAQRSIIAGLHYAIRTPGLLLLGRSETIREFQDLFSLIDKRVKLFRSNPGFSRIHSSLFSRPQYPEFPGQVRRGRSPRQEDAPQGDLQRAVDRIVVTRHGPPGVLVDDNLEIVQTFGDTSSFLMLPRGEASLNVIRMSKEGFGPVLGEALSRALNSKASVIIENVRIPNDLAREVCTVDISPIEQVSTTRRYYLILFLCEKQLGTRAAAPPFTEPTESGTEGGVVQLRKDLASTKVYLDSLLEEREGSTQELISANEEIQSSNEELQSINEELETAKEELQSQTEELQTVNEELHRRNEDLTRTTSDLVNLLNNLTMPVVILTADLHIRQFTPLAEKLLSMRAADVGRHIREIRLNLRVDDLEPWLLDVIENLTTKEMEVEDRNGRWHVLRARPYRTVEHRIEGVVLVLFEIDNIRRAQQELTEANQFSTAVIESVQVPLAVLDTDLRIQTANRAFQDLVQMDGAKLDNRSLPDIADGVWSLAIQPAISRLSALPENESGIAFEHEFDQGKRTLMIHVQVIRHGGREGILLSMEDITSRKKAQHLLRRENQRLEGRVQMTEDALSRSNSELQRLAARLFTAQEEERQRVARDLHDDLSQKIALLEMQVEKIEKYVDGDENARQGFAEVRRRTGELAEDLKRVAHELHPQILDDLGLAAALERLAKEFEVREDMPVRFVGALLPSDIPQAIASSLYRLIQESLHNISKHAGNTPVLIQLRGGDGVLHLEVSDEGVGFDVAAARLSGGMGLVSMQERVRLLGGTLAVTSHAGEGTKIEATIPLPGGAE